MLNQIYMQVTFPSFFLLQLLKPQSLQDLVQLGSSFYNVIILVPDASSVALPMQEFSVIISSSSEYLDFMYRLQLSMLRDATARKLISSNSGTREQQYRTAHTESPHEKPIWGMRSCCSRLPVGMNDRQTSSMSFVCCCCHGRAAGHHHHHHHEFLLCRFGESRRRAPM